MKFRCLVVHFCESFPVLKQNRPGVWFFRFVFKNVRGVGVEPTLLCQKSDLKSDAFTARPTSLLKGFPTEKYSCSRSPFIWRRHASYYNVLDHNEEKTAHHINISSVPVTIYLFQTGDPGTKGRRTSRIDAPIKPKMYTPGKNRLGCLVFLP